MEVFGQLIFWCQWNPAVFRHSHEFLLCIFTLQPDLRRSGLDLPARSQLRFQILTPARLGRNLRASFTSFTIAFERVFQMLRHLDCFCLQKASQMMRGAFALLCKLGESRRSPPTG